MGVALSLKFSSKFLHGLETLFLACLILPQLLINSGEAGQPPKFSEQPVDSLVPKNEPVTLNCQAEGDPLPTILWTKDGQILTQISDGKQLRFPLPSGSLFFLRVRSQDAGVYACRASNSYGQVTSRDATLEVATLREDFRVSPQNTWIAQGETAILECEPPRGNPEPKVFWKRNGVMVDVKGTGRLSLLGLGSLSISDVRENDEGNYICVGKSIVGMRQSNPAHLRVTVRPQFTIVPSNTSALLGSDVSLVCVARGDPPPEISWNKERGSLPLKRARFDEDRFLIANVSAEDAGVYRCIAENKAGSIISTATITILSPPFLVVKPHDLELQPNSTALLHCVADGEPRPILFWSKEGSHSIIFQGTSSHNSVHVNDHGTLKIDNISERDEGFWYCGAVSYAGSIVYKIHLKVTPLEDLPPPIILIGAGNETRESGGVVVMPCHATGTPLPVIMWYKDSNSFNFNHRRFTDAAGTLRITDLSLEDGGMYECVASSRSGKYVWKSFLTVTPLGDNENGANFKSPHFPASELTRPSPMKPHIVKVDSTSVTIAWHPKYFQVEKDTTRATSPADEMLNDETAGFDRKSKMAEESESEYDDELGRFETTVKKLREEIEETDGEEEEQESNQNGNNLIIQSRPPANISTLRSNSDESTTTNSKSPASTLRPKTDFQSKLVTPALIRHSGMTMRKSQITFNVEYYSAQEVKSEWLLGATVSTETVTLQYLKPNAEYVFFVRSVSGDGLLSPPSPLSDPVHTSTFSARQSDGDDVSKARAQLEAPVVVLLKSAYATSSTSVKIEWQIVTSGDFIEGFYIYFRPVLSFQDDSEVNDSSDDGSTRNYGYQMLTVLNTGTYTFPISGLAKYRTYQIFLIPFYKNVDGRPSNYLNVTTAQDVPSAPPEIIDAVQVNSTALVIRWTPPPVKFHHGIIVGYQLRVSTGSTVFENRTANAAASSLVLSNLTPGESYDVQISAYTIKGIGVFSKKITAKIAGNISDSKDKTVQKRRNKSQLSNKQDEMDNRIQIYFGEVGTDSMEANEEQNEVNTDVIDLFNSDQRPSGPHGPTRHPDNPNEFLTEVWFIALIGSVIFLMMLVFVFALYMRRSHIRNDMDKLRVSTAEIPDGSMPPHYPDDNLWIDSSHQTKQISINKCSKGNDLNEYENGNNYAVVEDRHSPIAYATTTLINGEKHKSNFGVFGEPGKCLSLLNGESGGILGGQVLPSRPNGFGLMAPSKMGGWSSNIGTTSTTTSAGGLLPPNNKTGSLNTSAQEMKNEIGKGASLNVLTTFQTPLPGRKQMVVDFSSGNPAQQVQSVKSSILKYHEPRLSLHSQLHLQHPPPSLKNQNYSHLQTHSGYNSNNSSHF